MSLPFDGAVITARQKENPAMSKPSDSQERTTQFDRFAHCLQQLGLLWLLVCLGLLFFSQLAKAATENPHDARAGLLYFTHADSSRQRALHLNSRVEMDIKGMSARVQLWQEFTNSTDQWVEGIYVFPLPEDSAVNFMRMHIGERIITGRIRERAAARAEYQAALREGRRAALTEQERPNLFTQSLANIGPGETVRVELHYIQSVRYDSGSFRLRFPMTLTPRYIPGVPDADFTAEMAYQAGASGWAMATDLVPDARRITPRYLSPTDKPLRNPLTLTIRLEAGMPLASVDSATHTLAVRRLSGSQARHEITLASGSVAMDRDFELQWQPRVGSEPAAAVFHEQQGGESYVQLMLLPPRQSADHPVPPRELILVIDTSGSMSGTSIVQARQGLLLALERLSSGDRFNVIEFNSSHRALFPEPVQADRHNVHMAMRFVNSLKAGGGTEMIPPLREALRPGAEGYLQQVVFITDGSVGNEQQVLELIEQQRGDARLFAVGIGSAPNSYFLRKAAQLGRGAHTHIGTVQQVAVRMEEMFRKLEQPAITSLQLQWPGSAESYPSLVPDLYIGEPLFVHVRSTVPLVRGDSVTVSGVSAGTGWQRRLEIPPASDVQTESGVTPLASQWAREKISSLLDSALGRSNREEVRARVLPVALSYQLLSPYTSFVAVEEQISRPANTDVAKAPVLNQLPAGQKAAAVAYPQGATAAGVRLLLGLLALLLAVGLWLVRRHGRG
jgi:Ca-activated chloride channel family protein